MFDIQAKAVVALPTTVAAGTGAGAGAGVVVPREYIKYVRCLVASRVWSTTDPRLCLDTPRHNTITTPRSHLTLAVTACHLHPQQQSQLLLLLDVFNFSY
jgi:hypothetical protein